MNVTKIDSQQRYLESIGEEWSSVRGSFVLRFREEVDIIIICARLALAEFKNICVNMKVLSK